MTHLHFRTAIGAMILAGALSSATAEAGSYTFYTIDGPSGSSLPQVDGISPGGTAVGYYTVASGYTNFSVDLNAALPNRTDITSGLNNLDSLWGINDSNQVVGNVGGSTALYAQLSGSTITGRTVAPLAATGDGNYFFYGLNNAGMAVGGRIDVNGIEHGMIFNINTGSYTNIAADAISTAGSPIFGELHGINSNGIAVGLYNDTSSVMHAYVYDSNTNTPTLVTDPSGATFTQLSAVNDSGLAVGYYVNASDQAFGIIYNTLTNTYVTTSFSVPGADNLTVINGIDNNGDLSGFYIDANGDQHGFVAIVTAAVPEPSSVVLLSLGGLAVALVARRKLA